MKRLFQKEDKLSPPEKRTQPRAPLTQKKIYSFYPTAPTNASQLNSTKKPTSTQPNSTTKKPPLSRLSRSNKPRPFKLFNTHPQAKQSPSSSGDSVSRLPPPPPHALQIQCTVDDHPIIIPDKSCIILSSQEGRKPVFNPLGRIQRNKSATALGAKQAGQKRARVNLDKFLEFWKVPNTQTHEEGQEIPAGGPEHVAKVLADGNCFYRALSVFLTGSECYHQFMRGSVVTYQMKAENDAKLAHHYRGCKSGAQYVEKYKMYKSMPRGTWATDAEIQAAAYLTGYDIYIYNASQDVWQLFPASGNITTRTRHAIYLRLKNAHYEPIMRL